MYVRTIVRTILVTFAPKYHAEPRFPPDCVCVLVHQDERYELLVHSAVQFSHHVRIGRSVDRSIACPMLVRSVDRSVAWSIARSLDRSLQRSHGRSLGRSIARSLPPTPNKIGKNPNFLKFKRSMGKSKTHLRGTF